MKSASRTRRLRMILGLGASVAMVACGSDASTSAASGGATSTGGAAGGRGGVAGTSTGGTISSGGISGTAGVSATGGSTAAGGAPGSGGSTSSYSLPPACPTHTTLSCPAIDSTKTFGSLSQAEVSTLCDCEIAAYGGLGTSQTCMCADGSMALNTNPPSKAACVAAHKATAACTWLMNDYIKCMNLTQDSCNMMALTASLGDPSCQAGGMTNPACTTGQ